VLAKDRFNKAELSDNKFQICLGFNFHTNKDIGNNYNKDGMNYETTLCIVYFEI